MAYRNSLTRDRIVRRRTLYAGLSTLDFGLWLLDAGRYYYTRDAKI